MPIRRMTNSPDSGMSQTPISSATQGAPSKKIAEYRKRFQSLAKAHVAALILDAEGTIRHVTPAARRLLGYDLNEPLMPCFFSHVHGHNMYQVMRDIADMVCYGKPKARWLLRLRTSNGRFQWFQTTVTNHLDYDEPTIKIVVGDLSGT